MNKVPTYSVDLIFCTIHLEMLKLFAHSVEGRETDQLNEVYLVRELCVHVVSKV